jgi:hypothetical protein
MLTKLARSFLLVTVLAASGFAATSALAEKIKDSGSIDAAYVKRDMVPVPGQEGHALLLTESTGTSGNPDGLIDGFAATVYEIADLRQGNGQQQGYVVFKQGPDQQIVRFEGMVTTTMKDGQPNTSMKGKYVLIDAAGALAGLKGDGTYTGYFTAEDKFHIDWDGWRSQPDSVAKN